MALGDAYREYSGELTGYAAVLEGPETAAAVVTEAVARLESRSGAEVSRSDLYRVVYEVALDRLRLNPQSVPLLSSDTNHEEKVRRLATLSLDERAVLFLADGVGLEADLIGHQLGFSGQTVSALHARARQKLNAGQVGSKEETRAFMNEIVGQAPPPPVIIMDDADNGTRRRRSPRIVAVATILTIVALIAPYPFLTDSSSIAPVTTTPSDVPPAGAVSFQGIVYLLQDPPREAGDPPSLVAFEVSAIDVRGTLEQGDDDVAFLVKMTDLEITLPLQEPNAPTTAAFYSMVPSQTRLRDASTVVWRGVETLVLDMNSEFIEGTGSELGDIAMLNQIVYTATQSDPAQGVWFTIEGEPIEAFGVSALDISTPIYRDSLRDHLNPILIVEPVTVDLDDQTVTLHGWAKTATASVTYRLVSSQLGEVGQGSAPISCGQDCWGEFRVVLPASAMPPEGVLRVFEAEEGTESNRVDLYMPAGFDGRWDLSR